MKSSELKYVKGCVQPGQPADIYYYTDVDYWSVRDFIFEFDWLVECNVSQINIHINSVGGSVVDGMSVFSRILDCKIPTACYNDGLAASMGSIIWAAGKEVYMKDYALLMIHNPFNEGDGKTYDEVTDAFKKQLKIIYQKRFGLEDGEIEAIMNGEEGRDGTFFTAEEAVDRGFVSESHIIETPAAIRAKVNAVVKNGFDVSKLKAVMSSIAPIPKETKIQDKVNNSNKNKMNEEQITVFAALLGISGEKATVEGVSAKINALKETAGKADSLKASLDKANKELATVKTELEGSKASVKNLNDDLKKAKDALKVYQDAEAQAQKNKVESLVNDAITAGKIEKDDREKWVRIAQSDFDLAKGTLDSIKAREDIGKKIAGEEKKDAQQGMETEEARAKAAVDKVVGEGFRFRTLE